MRLDNLSLVRSLSKPFIIELPFIVVFLLLMGGGDYLLYLIDVSNISNVYKTISWLSIWFLFAYLFASLFVLTNRRFVKYIVYFTCFSLFAVQHYLLQNFGSPITPTYLTLLAETNQDEVGNFIHLYLSRDTILPTIKILAAYVIIAFTGEFIWTVFIRNRRLPDYCYLLSTIILVPVIAFGLYSSKVYYDVLKEESPDRIRMLGCPEDFISSTFSSFRTIKLMKRDVNEAIFNSLNTKDITFVEGADSNLNIILIIGESFSKWHSQLYGYEKDTTPFLENENQAGSLFVLNNVFSLSNSTSVVLKNVLSCNSYSENEQWYSKPYFPSIFLKAGYNVYMWDNQRLFNQGASLSFTLNGYIYNDSIASSSYTKCNSESFPFDEDLITSFCDSVGVSPSGRNLIIFHLIGQHFDAATRYPHNQLFDYFSADSINRKEPWIDDSALKHIAEYDNATRYNDYVISRIIEYYRNTNCFLIYFSDHGEEVYDYRNQIGRDQGTLTEDKLKYQYEIPFFVWTSSNYAANHPDVILALNESIDTPYMSDRIAHMLMHVAGIESSYYVPQYDILCPDYLCSHRILADSDEDFELLDVESYQ